ncbi:MAG TPA: hydantoinase/oxoprolinase family protein [Peptococcaceae bacterium]|nr:hydantoinase/oxoprolinase family protein [Peptococcaceae bacterium]
MGSIIGIDVGGTFTDAVLIAGTEIIKTGKIPTQSDDLLNTILNALDYLEVSKINSLEQITVSTTLVTNAILQKRLPPIELVLFPGSGMKLSSLNWPVAYRTISGELDYRGRIVAPVNQGEWQALAEDLIKDNSSPKVAIVSKFSHRNNSFEKDLAAFLKDRIPNISLALGSEWGQANFYRRSLTTYLNLACRDLAATFATQLQNALKARGCQAPVRVLKADGGVLPLTKVRPVESIYSGPAASVLGALALSNSEESYIVVDVGGTTTDIGLVLSGKPLMSSKGAQIASFLTNVRSLAVRSIPVGGDSSVLTENGKIVLADYRLGSAYCLGGTTPTPTDAMCYLGLINYGNYTRAEEALNSLLPENQQNAASRQKIAEQIIKLMTEKITQAIEQLLKEWRDEPAYKIWEVLNKPKTHKFQIQLSGGGAEGIVAALEEQLKARVIWTSLSPVSNAIGAALAKPTFSWTLNLDTYLKRYRIEETGEQGEWTGAKKPHREVENFLFDLARRQGESLGINMESLEKEPFDYFPLVEGYYTVGQIIRGSVHVPPGVIQTLAEGGK